MKNAPLNRIKAYWQQQQQRVWGTTERWLSGTSERALNRAYEAALRIRALEEEYFNGAKIVITAEVAQRYSASVPSYLHTELNKELATMRRRLAEFKASNALLPLTSGGNGVNKGIGANGDQVAITAMVTKEKVALVLEKLAFIDNILEKYKPVNRYARDREVPEEARSMAVTKIAETSRADGNNPPQKLGRNGRLNGADVIGSVETVSDKTGILPRSILGTVSRITRELGPEAEEEVVKEFRSSKTKTILSLRFILLLMLIPLLTQQLTKNFILAPIVDRIRPNPAEVRVDECPSMNFKQATGKQATVEPSAQGSDKGNGEPSSSVLPSTDKTDKEDTVFINIELEEEAFQELQRFEEKLRFENLIRKTPKYSPEEVRQEVRCKAIDLADTYHSQSNGAIENVFADFFSIITFGLIIVYNKRQVNIFKSFIDDVIYGLSDSAKAFIIILLTDIFVGFHSPHGWEVILEGLCRHLGLPANREFIFIFIATFPVILDTIFKYWIFRYLNRISPSAVATYKNMNE